MSLRICNEICKYFKKETYFKDTPFETYYIHCISLENHKIRKVYEECELGFGNYD